MHPLPLGASSQPCPSPLTRRRLGHQSLQLLLLLLRYGIPRRSVTARLCASSPSTSAILATDGPSRWSPSYVNDCTVIFFWNESRDTPLCGRGGGLMEASGYAEEGPLT